MRWLEALQNWLREELKHHPKLVLMGDFNITFDDADTWNPVGMKDQIHCTDEERHELNALLANRPAAEPSLHPNLANIYREKIASLHEALADPATKDEAFSIIRSLIDEVRLVPEDGQLRVEIRGALAGILALSAANDKTARVGPDGSVSVLEQQMKLVAGARFELTTFRL